MKANIFLILLAVQVAIQPTLTKKYIPKDVPKSLIVFLQELCKLCISFILLLATSADTNDTIELLRSFRLRSAMLPALLYSIQNIAMLHAQQNLDAVTFNVINQTKIISAAVCCYILLEKKQSFVQMIALVLLMLSASIIEGLPDSFSFSHVVKLHFSKGVAPLLLSSFISGLSGAITQKVLQNDVSNMRLNQRKSCDTASDGSVAGKNPFLFTMELCAASIIVLFTSRVLLLCCSQGGRENEDTWRDLHNSNNRIFSFHAPRFSVVYPILSNAVGGIVVGLVTKHNGAVRKGFGIMIGIMISVIMQCFISSKHGRLENSDDDPPPKIGVSTEQIIGCLLVLVSLYLHSSYPYVERPLISLVVNKKQQ